MLDVRLKRNLLRFAKSRAPRDTGNLQDNAINGKFMTNPSKFTINYSVTDAYYLEYLENGMFAGGSNTKENKNKHFILNTYLDIANMLNSYFNDGKDIKKYSKIKDEFSLEKTMRHIKSLEGNRVIKEVEREIMSTTI